MRITFKATPFPQPMLQEHNSSWCSSTFGGIMITLLQETIAQLHVYTHISLGHPERANTEQIRNFSGFSHVLVQCTKISFRRGGYVYAFRNL